jgi:hypothetical protein
MPPESWAVRENYRGLTPRLKIEDLVEGWDESLLDMQSKSDTIAL